MSPPSGRTTDITRRFFAPRTWPAWAAFVFVLLSWLWWAVKAWATVEFFLAKLPLLQEAIRSLPEVVPSYLTAPVLQTILVVSGLVWLWLTAIRMPAPPAQAAATAADPPRRKPRSQRELREVLEPLLVRALQHGEAIHAAYDWKLAREWEERTAGLILAAFGEEERARFAETAYFSSPRELVQYRMEKLMALGRRLEFTAIRDDFDPKRWQGPE